MPPVLPESGAVFGLLRIAEVGAGTLSITISVGLPR